MNSQALALAVLLLSGCSSESTPSGSPQTTPSAFDKYCKGTLKVSKEYLRAVGPSTWSGNGATVPAGTSILLSKEFSHWTAYTPLGDGTIVKLRADFTNGLVPGTDFDSTCFERANDSRNERTVLLKRSTFYGDAMLTGTACTLEAGQVMTNFGYVSSGGSASVSSAELQATCGYARSYSKDIAYAKLIAL